MVNLYGIYVGYIIGPMDAMAAITGEQVFCDPILQPGNKHFSA